MLPYYFHWSIETIHKLIPASIYQELKMIYFFQLLS